MVTFPSVALLLLFGTWLPLGLPRSIRNICICLDSIMDTVQVLSHGGPGPHTSKRMQLDSYLSIHKHSATLTPERADDLRTGGRLVPHASISEPQPERTAPYGSGIPRVVMNDGTRAEPGAGGPGRVLIGPLTCCFRSLSLSFLNYN